MANQLEDSMKEGDNPLRITIRPPGVKNYDGATDNNWLHNFMKSNEPSPLIDGIKKLADYLQNTQFSPGTRTGNRIFGTGGEERYQFWPERMVRSALTLPGDVMSGSTPVQSIDPVTGEAHTSPQAIERAQDTAGLMGSSTLFRAPTPATLGSGAMRFYSPVEQAIENATQKSGPLQQWLGFLKNSKGVKPEELSWLGLENAPELQGNITKQQLQDYVNAHKVDLREVTRRSEPNNPKEMEAAIEQHAYELMEDGEAGSLGEALQMARTNMEDPQIRADYFGSNSARYGGYQLPGGENYREHLLTLPSKEKSLSARELAKENGDDWDTLTTAERQEYEADAKTYSSSDYRSSHWDEPNVLAHIRSNERDVEGVPSLHLEEIQSDWHQAGRKKGYKQDNKNKLSIKNEGGIWRVRDENGERVDLNGASGFTTEDGARNAIANNTRDIGGVPDAPFKTSWPELALKRMIQLAAQEGKTRISWTPGEAQAARYDLSKQIDSLFFTRNPDGSFDLRAKPKNGNIVSLGQNVPPEKLSDLVGKEMAQKLEKEEIGKGGNYRGLDLKVGGEGMKGFYDKMLPKMVEKLGKQYGVKVKQGSTPTKNISKTIDDRYSVTGDRNIYNTQEEAIKAASEPIYYFDIPPELAAQATGKGMPLFVGGVPVIPVEGNPFEEKKK